MKHIYNKKMQISETTSTQNDTNPQNQGLSYQFSPLGPIKLSKETEGRYLLWGLKDTLKMDAFRFNISFNDLNNSAFLVDLMNNASTQESIREYFPSALPSLCSEVQFHKLKCSKMNLNFIDDLQEAGVISKTGRIKMAYNPMINEIDINSVIREAYLMEESEHYEALSGDDRKELIVQLLMLLIIGGSLNQYDEII